MRSSVDLPQPELPSNANSSPFFTDRLTPLTAVRFVEFLHDIDDLHKIVRIPGSVPGSGLRR